MWNEVEEIKRAKMLVSMMQMNACCRAAIELLALEERKEKPDWDTALRQVEALRVAANHFSEVGE